MVWEINGTDEFAEWFGRLAELEQDEVIAVVELLAHDGPTLGRPHADRIASSKYHNMKELRPRGEAKHLRILYMFDPRREAVLLLGGEKRGQWDRWYTSAVPEAERLYERYLAEIDSGGASSISR